MSEQIDDKKTHDGTRTLQPLVVPPHLNEVVCADCLQTLRELPDGCIDAVITDPPYCSGGVSEASRTSAKCQGVRSEKQRFGWFVGDNMGTAGLVWMMRELAIESVRLLKGSGSALIFCDWRMIPNLVPAIESAGLRFQNLVVWDKGHMGMGQGFRCRHEMILHMTAGSPQYFNKGTANVLKAGRVNTNEREHQTQKPLGLMRELINVVCPPEGIVLDPFCGSGSTLVAAKEAGRQWIGIEREQAHAETARRRLHSVMF